MAIETLQQEYFELMSQQVFDESDMDYAILERHKDFLSYMSQVDNSGITVFDLHKKEHVFASYNFSSLFGYDMQALEQSGTAYFDAQVHPDDYPVLLQNGINIFRFFLSAPAEHRLNLKAINEYRILNGEKKYVRVIEQHQMLELDKKGNVWLSLGIIDISPNQDVHTGVRNQLINYKTGELIDLANTSANNNKPSVELSKREKEVLSLIKDGLLSKEISEKLFISVHTVNTHRQRILEKLDANNSQEAIKYASLLGLLH